MVQNVKSLGIMECLIYLCCKKMLQIKSFILKKNCMKKIFSISLAFVTVLLCSCITKVMVDSPQYPVATYDDITHNFSGKLNGTLANVFKATNIALERDLNYFRVGQVPKDKEWLIYARGKRDLKIVVNLREEKAGVVSVDISYGEDNLVACQQIFAAIVKNLKNYAQ